MTLNPEDLCDVHAEDSVVGALMLNPDMLYAVELRSDEFFNPLHRHAYEAICDLKLNRGVPVDVLTVSDAMREAGVKGERVESWLAGIAALVPTAANVGWYARIVRRFSTKRRLLTELSRLLSVAQRSDPSDVAGLVEEVQRSVIRACDAGSHIESAGSGIDASLSSVTPESADAECVHFGIDRLDTLLWGVPVGSVSLIAGRPSQGKSCLARILALNVAMTGDHVGYVSLEERRRQFHLNLLAYKARVSITSLMRGRINASQRIKLQQAADWIRGLPIHVCYDRPLTPEQVCQRLRQMKAEHKIKLAVVDYWNRVSMPGRRTRLDEANDFVERVTSLAGELEIALVVVCQLSRENEKENRPPRLSDLKETGGWEESATTVVMVHRPHFYDKSKGSEDEIELYVRKQKAGKTGMRKGYWEGHFLSILDEKPEEGQVELPLPDE